jgi:DNA (cytosine-5)-methyltransferase 1
MSTTTVRRRRPRLLDLFCGEGGAAAGYAAAGFDVTGVDVTAMPRYPFRFVQGDALEFLAAHGAEFDVIHASPPCQGYSEMRHAHNARAGHPRLIAPTRALLLDLGLPYVIENVQDARGELIDPITLCGSMFDLGAEYLDRGRWQLQRHRVFELGGMGGLVPPACAHTAPVIGIYGGHIRDRSTWRGGADFPDCSKIGVAREAMGMPWASWDGLSQAIPPAFTAYLGRHIIGAISGPPGDGIQNGPPEGDPIPIRPFGLDQGERTASSISPAVKCGGGR